MPQGNKLLILPIGSTSSFLRTGLGDLGILGMKAELERLINAIAKFEMVDAGYPKEPHVIGRKSDPLLAQRIAADLGIPGSADFVTLYTESDGISIPDVNVGYRIYTLEKILTINSMPSEPNSFDKRRIVVLGSDGGGGRFALTLDNGQIYYLPMAGVSPDRVYLGQPRMVASSVSGLVEFLANETEKVASAS